MTATDDRDSILSRVRGALAPLHERAAMPDYTTELAVMRQMIAGRDLFAVFAERLQRVNGIALTEPTALVEKLRAGGWTHGYCDPVLWPQLAPHFGADFKVETEFDRIHTYPVVDGALVFNERLRLPARPLIGFSYQGRTTTPWGFAFS